MKHKIVLLVLFLYTGNLFAQNVGIGNTDPLYKLDLSGRMRIRGGAGNENTAGLWLGGINTDSATNKLFFGMKNDSSLGFYSLLNSNNQGWFFVANGRNGNVGISNSDPKYPLSFENQSGGKISLYQEGNGNYYGIGIGNLTMQLMTPHSNSSIVFGYGASNNFTENMRIGGNGNIAIGTTDNSLAGLTINKKVGATHALFGANTTGVAIESSFPGIGFNSYYFDTRRTIAAGYSGYMGVNPVSGGMQLLVSAQSNNKDATGTYKTAIDIKHDGKVGIGVTDQAYLLDVGGRMRIRSTPGFTAGLWLNNASNGTSPAFFGMLADDQVGLFGSGTGWSFLMNTQTGAISFGGNAGQPGQVLTSNGTAGAPSWQGGGGNNLFIVRQTTGVSVTNNIADIPGAVADFTLTAPSRVLFHYSGRAFAISCLACGDKRISLNLYQNVVGGSTEVDFAMGYVPNGSSLTLVSGPAVFDLPAGVYSYKLTLEGSGSIVGSMSIARLTWQIFPN
jgi:hypothetical protein